MQDDLESSIRFDQKRLAELGKKAIGDRTISAFAAQTGLSRAFISRLINGSLLSRPKRSTLYRFAGPDAQPQGGVTAEDLIAACSTDDPVSSSTPDKLHSTSESALPEQIARQLLRYYSPSPSLGLSLFLDTLAQQNHPEEVTVRWKPDGTARVQTVLSGKQAAILPCFCLEPKAYSALVISVLQRIFLLLADDEFRHIPFYIMTDSRELYHRLAVELTPLSTQMVFCIVKSSEDHCTLEEQTALPSGQKLPFSLVSTV